MNCHFDGIYLRLSFKSLVNISSCWQKEDFVVAVKVIAKKNISKTQNLLAKEIKILKVSLRAINGKIESLIKKICLVSWFHHVISAWLLFPIITNPAGMM